MFLHGDRLEVDKKVAVLDPGSRVAVNVSPYVRPMGPIVEANRARYPELVYVAQDIETLALMARGEPHPRADGTNPNPVELSHPLFVEDRARFFLDPRPWMEFLAERDFSFGTRIHGNIAALLAGTPAVVLAHDSRTLELARYHEIPYRPIAELPRDVDAADLHDVADYGPLVRGHRARYETYVAFLARHGLADGIFDPDRSAAFDARLAAIAFPPAVHVTTGRGRGSLAYRVRGLRRRAWIRRARTMLARIRM
jgi:hypothetical protein